MLSIVQPTAQKDMQVCKQVELNDTLRSAVLDKLSDKVHHHVRAVATQSLSGRFNVASISVKKYIDEMDPVLWNAVERLTQTAHTSMRSTFEWQTH